MDVTCDHCHAVFKRRHGQKPKYCSRQCYFLGSKGKPRPAYKSFGPDRRCETCGETKPSTQFSWANRKYRPSGADYRMRTCKKCWRKKYRESIRKTNREYEQRVRRIVVEGLGNRCACCGEETYEFLSIHHVGRWGKEHRQQFKKQLSLLRDIIKRNFPTELFEVLCWNCHMAHEFHGKCPHKKIFVLEEKQAWPF